MHSWDLNKGILNFLIFPEECANVIRISQFFRTLNLKKSGSPNNHNDLLVTFKSLNWKIYKGTGHTELHQQPMVTGVGVS